MLPSFFNQSAIGSLALSQFAPKPKRKRRNKQRRGAYADDANRDAFDASLATYGRPEPEADLLARGWVRDPELTGDNYITYTKNGEAMVAFRGTKVVDDLAPDADIFNNDFTGAAFTGAATIVKNAQQKYPKVTTVGHSLGGTKAIKAAGEGVKAIVFNPGAGLTALKTGDHQVFQSTQDPISANLSGNNITVKNGTHALSSFENEFY